MFIKKTLLNNHISLYIYKKYRSFKMKTLIVKYLPSGDNSNTKKLYDYLQAEYKDKLGEIEELDLLQTKIPYFDNESISAYYLRNYMGKALSESQELAIKPFDNILSKVMLADQLVLVFPMHNFSLPGIVKLFFDSFMFNGEFFNISDKVKKDRVSSKKVLVLYSHGGSYLLGSQYEKYDFVRSLLNQEFSFMGIQDVTYISYSTADPNKKEENLQIAKKSLDAALV